jgi:hypothetical protein
METLNQDSICLPKKDGSGNTLSAWAGLFLESRTKKSESSV